MSVEKEEVDSMTPDNPLDRETFDFLARAAGLNPDDPHMEELFPYVRTALAGNARLSGIEVTNYEPDTAFDPAQFYQE